MPWFLQFWPGLLILVGLTILANAMKNPLLGWLTAILALAGIGFGAWWLSHNKAAAETEHTTTHSLVNPLIQTVTIRATTLAGRLSVSALPEENLTPADRGLRERAHSLRVSIRGVGELSASHAWNVGGRTGEFVWPEHAFIPHTAPIGADISLRVPERTPVRLRTQSILSGGDLDLTRLRPESCDIAVVSGGVRVRVGENPPERIRLHGTLGAAESELPAAGPVRVEFPSPLTARSLPEDFLEHVGGRGKAKIWVSEGKGFPLLIQVDGTFFYMKIKRAAERAGG